MKLSQERMNSLIELADMEEDIYNFIEVLWNTNIAAWKSLPFMKIFNYFDDKVEEGGAQHLGEYH